MEPVSPKERIECVDVIRGLTLLLALWVTLLIDIPQPIRWHNKVINYFTDFFAGDIQFQYIFALLFGAGLATQMDRVESTQTGLFAFHLRKILSLFVIGLLHYVILWSGDILRTYACIGFFIIFFRRLKIKWLFTIAMICIVIPVFISPIEALTSRIHRNERVSAKYINMEAFAKGYSKRKTNENSIWNESNIWEEARTREEYYGSYLNLVLWKLDFQNFALIRINYYLIGSVFAMFLLGICASKRGLIWNVPDHRIFLFKLTALALSLGLISSFADVLRFQWIGNDSSQSLVLFSLFSYALRGPSLAIAYVCILALVVTHPRFQRRFTPFSWIGRTALSSYLLQSSLFTFVYCSYGLGLHPTTNGLMALGLTPAIFLIEILLSRWWLNRFEYGPMEWLWRSLSYGKLQPMKART